MGGDPGGEILGQAGFGIVVVAASENGDEEICLAGLPRFSVDYGHALARPVDKQLLAGLVRLAHGNIDLTAPPVIQVAEPAVLVAVGMLPLVLRP